MDAVGVIGLRGGTDAGRMLHQSGPAGWWWATDGFGLCAFSGPIVPKRFVVRTFMHMVAAKLT